MVQVELHPRLAMGSVILLEGMVRTPWLKTFWRLWSLPPPLPDSVHTWAAVWHRALALRQAFHFDLTDDRLTVFQFDFKAPRRTNKQAVATVTKADPAASAVAQQEAVQSQSARGGAAQGRPQRSAAAGAADPSNKGASTSGGVPETRTRAAVSEVRNENVMKPETQAEGGRRVKRRRSINAVAGV